MSRRWDEDYLRTVSTKLRTEDAAAFLEWCDHHQLTRHEALRLMIGALLDEWQQLPASSKIPRHPAYSLFRGEPHDPLRLHDWPPLSS